MREALLGVDASYAAAVWTRTEAALDQRAADWARTYTDGIDNAVSGLALDTFENIYIGQLGPVGFWGACAITLAESAVVVAVLIPFMKRRLALR